jgi:hypothetical protein
LKKFQIILTGIFVLFLLKDCAKIGSPMGGPKDETPPRVLKSNPENYSLRFKEKRIEIAFDEFIQLKNINQELVVSPPLEEKPVVRLKNKSIIIDLNGNFLDSTTYTLNFGQAIADNNESNLLENYQFVFSTGNYIDSLGISGLILNAFDLKPSEEPVTVMLYDEIYDSVPYKKIPRYIGKSTKKGYFEINNVKDDTFKVFALKDKNYNLIYDLPDEEIGFLDTTIILSAKLIREFLDSVSMSADTAHNDSIPAFVTDTLAAPVPDSLLQDSLVQDTITFPKRNKYSVSFELFFFKEDKKPQYMLGSSRTNSKKLGFNFNRPLTDSIMIEPLNFTCDRNWYILEKNVSGDSLIYWIKDSMIYNLDTLLLHLKYPATDSLNNDVPFNDTVRLVYTKEIVKSRKKDDKSEPEKESLKLSISIGNGATQDIYKAIAINSEFPVQNLEVSKIHLFKRQDTLEFSEKFILQPDSLHLRKFWINHEWEETMNYRLFLEPQTFTDIYGITNDTIIIAFKTQSLDHYGRLIVNLANVQQDILLQLLNEKDNILRVKQLKESGSIDFSYLEPGKYKLKAIFDNNANGKWDTGKYLQKIQPEKVQFYTGEINVRANWDLEVNWTFKDEAVPSR